MQVFPGKEGSVDLVASRDIQASESLYLSYGNLDNDFLLLDYGQPPYPSLVRVLFYPASKGGLTEC